MEKVDLTNDFYELIRKTSTDLPEDVVAAIQAAHEREEEGSAARGAFEAILENIRISREESTPVCQDTGTPIFHVHHPLGISTGEIRSQIKTALARATEDGIMRPNAVDPVTGKNSGNNLGIEFPTVHFEEWDDDAIRVDLALKGGGSENVGVQYKLPDGGLGAGRDLEGVRKCVLDAVFKAQGKGCAPGIIGVGIGGDRGSCYLMSKAQFFRKLDDENPDPQLREFETRLFEELNSLGIGPMGFGGKTTVLGVKAGKLHRVPACYFVSVSYLCWAARRHSMTYRNGEVQID
jgi:fumarate hydratase class I